ncbi:hypothetical protein, partial [Piscinibacter sakaiensis]|uniref:hypothetical protein n=1 Tax=Piscinibacter sakaiensis TaxID=1547922 RepID=UPI0018D1142E
MAKLIAPVAAREPCRKFCFVYDLLAHFFSAQFANAVSGIMWFALATLFLVGGWRIRRKVTSSVIGMPDGLTIRSTGSSGACRRLGLHFILPQTSSNPTAPVNSDVMPPSNTTEKAMQRRLKLLPTLPDPRRLQRFSGAAFSAAPSLRIGMQHAASGSPAPRVFTGF